MKRAWPFEDVPEGAMGRRSFDSPGDFVAARPGDVEGVVVRIGMNDAQLVLVDGRGAWSRWVYHSVADARAAAEPLEVTVHDGAFPEELRVRINSYRRPPEDFDAGAYPEQGTVGPVIPYPENRPRRVEAIPSPEESS